MCCLRAVFIHVRSPEKRRKQGKRKQRLINQPVLTAPPPFPMQLQRATSIHSHPAPMRTNSSCRTPAPTAEASISTRRKRPERAGTISWRIHEMASREAATSPLPSSHRAISAFITLLTHCVIVTVCHIIQNSGGYGIVSLIFCAVHLSILLGFFSPPPPGRALIGSVGWWVPSQVHEPLASCSLLLIGLVHFLGVGIIEFGTETLECPVDVESLVRSSYAHRSDTLQLSPLPTPSADGRLRAHRRAKRFRRHSTRRDASSGRAARWSHTGRSSTASTFRSYW